MSRAWTFTTVIEGVLPRSGTEPLAVADQPWRSSASRQVENGTVSGKADFAILRKITLTSGQTVSLDFTAIAGGGGPSLGDGTVEFAELQHIRIKALSTNTTAVTVQKNGTNGFDKVVGSGSKTLAAGEVLEVSSKMTVDGTHKVLDLVNGSGATAYVEVAIVGLLA